MPDSILDYVKVVGRVGLTVGDGSDDGKNPDLIAPDAGGTITFTPLATFAKVAGAVPPVLIGNAVITCVVDTEGYLTYNGDRFVWLVDLGSDKINPRIANGVATYKVDFDLRFNNKRVGFPSFTCHPLPDIDNDIAVLAPVPTGTGTPIIVGPVGTGVDDLSVEGGRLVVTLTDGEVVDAGALPVGPGGSDAGVASYIRDPESDTSRDLSASTAELIGAVAPEKRLFVTPRGNDADDGLTLGKAKATVGAALTALGGTGGSIDVGYGTVTESAAWGLIPDGVSIRGCGRGATTILHAFNGDLASLGTDVHVEALTIAGQGGARTGRCFYVPAGKARQRLTDVALPDWDGYCLEFHYQGGSQFRATSLAAYRTGGGTGTGKYAVKVSDTQQLTAYPKTFLDFQSEGFCAIDFGGGNDFQLVGSVVADLRFTPDTRGVNMVATRWLNQAAATIDGHNNSVVACDINPALTIAAGADANQIGPNSYNAAAPVTDNSGNGRNNLQHATVYYTPVLSTATGTTALGNGTLIGRYTRTGSLVTVEVQLVVGSTTTFGSGSIRISLPVPRQNGVVTPPGGSVVFSTGGPSNIGVSRILGAVDYVEFLSQAGGLTPTYPSGGMKTGDYLVASIAYSI